MAVKILLVDDHPLFRAGLRGLLDTVDKFAVVGEATDGNEAILKVKELKPDVVVMDITMPKLNGIEATKEILSFAADTKVLALSIHSGKQFVKDMLDAGAKGYLLKDSAPDELINAVQKIMKGEMYLSSTITKVALEKDISDTSINSEVLNTKLHRPPITNDYIIRTNIIDELENNSFKPLSLVSAPTGYGKSVVISQWLEKSSKLHTWISLDEEHDDLRVFLIYLHKAITIIFPGSLKKTYGLISASELPPLKIVSNTLINELDQLEEDFILVLDDYHRIHEEGVHQLVNAILRFPPEHMHLVLLTRRDPSLRLTALRSHNRLTEIRMQELAFSVDEVTSLFQGLTGILLSNETANSLLERTEGWIVGLRLASMSIKSQKDVSKFLQNFKGDIHMVSEFLLEEVLMSQPDEIIEILINSSILNRFSSKLVDVIISNSTSKNKKQLSGEQFIQYLVKANLFIIPLDDQNKWFRYHHLFQDILQKRLNEKCTVEIINNLHSITSDWFVKNGFISEAIQHATTANDFATAKKIIEENWFIALNNDKWYMVTEWLPFLPEKIVNNSISLLLLKAQVFYHKNMFAKIPPILEQVNQMDQKPNDFEAGMIACFQSIFSFIGGRGEEALNFSEQALKLIPKKYKRFRSDEETWMILSLHMIGKGKLAFQKIDEAIHKIEHPREPIQLSRYIAQKAFLNLMDVELKKLRINIDDFFKIKNLNSYTQTFADYLAASISWWQNDPDKVVNDFNPVIDNRYHVEAQLGIDAYIAKALALEELGRTAEANEVMNKAIDQAIEVGNEDNLSILKSGFARLALLQGDLVSAENRFEAVHNTGINPFILFWIEIPAITHCRILIANGSSERLNEALELLSGYLIKVKSWHNKLRTIEIAALQSLAKLKLGKKDEALEDLKYGIGLSSSSELIRPFVELGLPIVDLLTVLKNQDFEVAFIDKIIDHIASKGKKNVVFNKSSFDKEKSIESKELVSELSSRENDVLLQVANGLRNKEIANNLYISTDTVKKHLYNIFQKLHVSNRLELVNKAKELGLIEK